MKKQTFLLTSIVGLFFGILFFIGCQKDSNLLPTPGSDKQGSLSEELALLYQFNQSVDGIMELKQNLSVFGQDNIKGVMSFAFNGTFKNDNELGPLIIDGLTFNPVNNGAHNAYASEWFPTQTDIDMSGSFGKNVRLQLPNIGLDETFYAPKSIKYNLENFDVTAKIASGTNIVWQADPSNSLGVVLVFRYQPSEGKGFTRFVKVADNGSYVVKAEDIAGTPTRANIDVTLISGNFKHVSAGGKKILLYSYSSNSRGYYTL